ncbi:MAG: radical SAM protein [bacterium]|nr:radical SAM protein [bacterium]
MSQEGESRFVSAYLKLPREELRNRISRAGEILRSCTLCPRDCRVDRRAGEVGFCRTSDKPFVSSFHAHFGEEAPLVGSRGSGTIFFSHCNLGCLFCQNWTISHDGQGAEISCQNLAEMMVTLQERQGCHNINFVTPTHQVFQILEALDMAIDGGLKVPLVYNCGGYEAVETLRMLDGIVDIYMPDFKFAAAETAREYAGAEDYPTIVQAAIREMHRQVGDLVMDRQGIARRGLIVRHLVLPEGLAGTETVARFLAEEISPHTYTNIMDQYYPCYQAGDHPPLDRRLTGREYLHAVRAARDAGLTRLD